MTSETQPQEEIQRIQHVLDCTVALIKEASLTGALNEGKNRCIGQFNSALKRLTELGAVPPGFFDPLNEGDSLDDAGVACAQLAAYIANDDPDAGDEPTEEETPEPLEGGRRRRRRRKRNRISEEDISTIGEFIRRAIPDFLKKDKITLPSGLRFTECLQRTLQRARSEAVRLQNDYMGTEHLLLALTCEPESTAAAIFQSLDQDPDELRRAIEDYFRAPHGILMAADQIPFTPRVRQTLEAAIREARAEDAELVGTGHLLLALSGDEKSASAQVLAGLGITCDRIKTARNTLAAEKNDAQDTETAEELAEDRAARATLADIARTTQEHVSGYLHIHENGYGFLRPAPDTPPAVNDIYISHSQIERFGLKQGDLIHARARPPRGEEHFIAARIIEKINGKPLE